MRARRSNERPLRLIHVLPAISRGGGPVEARQVEYRIDPRSGSGILGDTRSAPDPDGRAAVLLELDPDRALLTAPSSVAPIGGDTAGRVSTAIRAVAAAEREIQRSLDRLQRCEGFVVLADLLATAESDLDVFQALVEHLPPILASWRALILRRPAGGEDSAALCMVGGEEFGLTGLDGVRFPDLPLPAVAQFERGALPGSGESLEAFARSVLARTAATTLACAGLREDAIVVLAERRAGRDFTPQDWDLLRVTVRQAAAALRRLG